MGKVTIHGKQEPKQPMLSELKARVGQYAVTDEGTNAAAVWRYTYIKAENWWVCVSDQRSFPERNTVGANDCPARLLEAGESFTVEVPDAD